MSTEAVVAILAALGGGGFLIQVFNAIRSYREGAKLRETEADERLVIRLEKEIAELRLERAQDADHIRRLIEALGKAGIDIPPRTWNT